MFSPIDLSLMCFISDVSLSDRLHLAGSMVENLVPPASLNSPTLSKLCSVVSISHIENGNIYNWKVGVSLKS